MIRRNNPIINSRRDFIRNTLAAGCLLSVRSSGVLALAGEEKGKVREDVVYQYGMVSVERLPEMKEDIEKLLRDDRASTNETFRGYLKNRKYSIPEDFPEVKTIIVVADFTPMAYVDFHHKGKKYELNIAPQYFDNGVSRDDIREIVQHRIVGGERFRVEPARGLMLKNLAVRSGLGRYGRNNIVYVGEMGTFITLHAFYTDYEPEEYGWGELRMTDSCQDCDVCMMTCPGGCIRREEFVIDVGRCVTLYNEVKGDFPDWMPSDAHNSLMGCMRCQLPCPENARVINRSVRLGPVDEEDTAKILAGTPDAELLASLGKKLKSFYPGSAAEYFPIFTRNLKPLLRE